MLNEIQFNFSTQQTQPSCTAVLSITADAQHNFWSFFVCKKLFFLFQIQVQGSAAIQSPPLKTLYSHFETG